MTKEILIRATVHSSTPSTTWGNFKVTVIQLGPDGKPFGGTVTVAPDQIVEV